MSRTRISCPNCRQPIIADLTQLLDKDENPSAKQQLLSGLINFVQCPHCGYQGNLATPIVYHDSEKELLLTFVPPELGLPRDEQERVIGGMINQVVNRLSAEKRKGYLLRPQAHLTMQSMVDRILDGDGITKEMIQGQQQRLNLVQRLLTASDDSVRLEVLKQEGKLVDSDLFNILAHLSEVAASSGDHEAAGQMNNLQAFLMENSGFGKQVKQQLDEVQSAIKSLQDAGKDLTREKLLALVIEAPNEIRLGALVSLTRPGIDYTFFQLLSERIEQAKDKERERLIALREHLLELTRQIDEQLETRTLAARNLLNKLLQAENISEATAQSLPEIEDLFLQVLNTELEAARKVGDIDKLGKLQQVVSVVQQASSPPPEVALIQELLEAPDDPARRKLFEEHRQELTSEFFQMLTGLLGQIQQSDQDPKLIERLQLLNKQALRFSMELNLRGE